MLNKIPLCVSKSILIQFQATLNFIFNYGFTQNTNSAKDEIEI